MTPTLDERQRLVLDNIGLAKYMVQRTAPALPLAQLAMDRDDLEQEALIAMWEASERFDPSRAKWSTFACLHMRQRIFSAGRPAGTRGGSGDPAGPEIWSRFLSVTNYAPENEEGSTYERGAAEDEYDFIGLSMLDDLTDQQRNILLRTHWYGEEPGVIAEAMGLSVVQVRLERERAYNTIKTSLDGSDPRIERSRRSQPLVDLLTPEQRELAEHFPIHQLSRREQQVLRLMLEGMNAREIGDVLKLTSADIRTTKWRAIQKIEAGPLPESEDDRMVREADLSVLSKRERPVIEALFFDHKLVEEVAEDMGLTPHNIRIHKFRGLAKLRARIQPQAHAA